MSDPADQLARERFASELDCNFSVVASAGSGKTRAITERIVRIARSPRATEWLPNLVVVTYTNRAANEMQQRARQEILRSRVNVRVIAAFNRAFFGTIHSFCVKLLTAHGHYLGLPPQMELIDDDEELWNDFVQRQQTIGYSLSERARSVLFRHIEIRKLMELGRRGQIGEPMPFVDEPCPELDFRDLLAFRTRRTGSINAVTRTQTAVREFESLMQAGADFVPLPALESKLLAKIWRETFGPFRNWLNRSALTVAAEVESAYREFRLTRGVFTYDDQVALARTLFQNPEAARRIRRKNYRVILDEAQDTAPSQFAVLLETARPADASGSWPNESSDPPRPGYFSMVGDFQQSIFGHHADLQNYQRVHEALVASPGGEALKFSVTFRLDQESVEVINRSFGELLSGNEGQVEFVELNARPEILPGQVLRVDLPRGKNLPPGIPERRTAAWEASELARWIHQAGLRNLRARCWGEVAILCPRKAWFQPLRDALRQQGFSVQIQSENEWRGDNPAYAWLTALLTIMAEPHCSYEVVGVLREVFGISDHNLAIYSEGKGHRFDLRRVQEGDNAVAAKLKLLAQIRHAIQMLPLFTAVEELIKTVQLRERLRALPEKDFEHLDQELDRLLALAANAEAEGSSFSDFAKYLRSNFSAQREPPAADEGSIQLITSQKAKGSEWQAVIVPFLARDVIFGNLNFPRFLPRSIGGESLVALNKDDITPELEELIDRARRQEMERLLYVALTRAKHTLVLVGDSELFARKSGRVPSKSQMKWLRCESGGCNEETFARLSVEAQACAETERRHSTEQQPQNISHLPKTTVRLQKAAEDHAADFVRKANPSGFKEIFDIETESTPENADALPVRAGRLDNAATLYGRWWHALLQRINWNEDFAKWNEIFQAALDDAPDRKRAEVEWKLFRAHVTGAGDFRKQFASDQFNARAEVPFLLKIKQSIALEGIIDLALIDAEARRGLIIDWKTNRIARREIDVLGQRYRPQIAAYWKAMIDITGLKVLAGLYSTCAGSLILYDDRELEREWSRLEKLPIDQMMGEVSAP
ncbi:MAG: UvrD-helicase domain-containing protein [Verrucomicrobiota bacterium]|nr:UvrD-helicase domain-containing protein [Verrucomicrobiota bacterium]